MTISTVDCDGALIRMSFRKGNTRVPQSEYGSYHHHHLCCGQSKREYSVLMFPVVGKPQKPVMAQSYGDMDLLKSRSPVFPPQDRDDTVKARVSM